MGKSSNRQKQPKDGDDNSNGYAVGDGDLDSGHADGASDIDMTDIDASLPDPVNHAQPQTCCPACHTFFEVTAELLASSDTRVRCGECLSIFDALINLRRDDFLDDDDDLLVDADGNIIDTDSPYGSVLADTDADFTTSGNFSSATEAEHDLSGSDDDLSDDTVALDVTYSDFDLFSGEVELPEVAYFDQTQDSGHLTFDDPAGDETFNDSLFTNDLTAEPVDLSPPSSVSATLGAQTEFPEKAAGFVTDETKSEPLDFQYPQTGDEKFEDSSSSPSRRSSRAAPKLLSGKHRRWAVRGILALVLLSIVAGLYGYRNRAAMAQDPSARPWLARLCVVVGCELPPMIALDALKVLKRSVFSHPTLENSLVIDLAFTNQAAFAQPYPVLEIRLTDRNGRLVVRNDVEPSAYLGQWQRGDLLQAGERLDLSLVVEDPGQNATSFELNFR